MARFKIRKRKYIFTENAPRWTTSCLICGDWTAWPTHNCAIVYIYRHDLVMHGMRPNAAQEEDNTRKGRS